jgi:hypothetical protein
VAVFGWQGFRLEHPDEWAAVHLSGDRTRGYARLASDRRIGCQIRWQKAKDGSDHGQRLEQYLKKLAADAKRAGETFNSEFSAEDGTLVYRWSGSGQGRGCLFHSSACSRTFFLEVLGGKKDQLLPQYREIMANFQSGLDENDREHWALFGLHVALPAGLELARHTLLAGRTQMLFRGKGVTVDAQRWGFAEQLLDKHGLEAWARAALEMKKAQAEAGSATVRLTRKGILNQTHAIVRVNHDENQIEAIKVTSRKPEWKVQWDWLV